MILNGNDNDAVDVAVCVCAEQQIFHSHAKRFLYRFSLHVFTCMMCFSIHLTIPMCANAMSIPTYTAWALNTLSTTTTSSIFSRLMLKQLMWHAEVSLYLEFYFYRRCFYAIHSTFEHVFFSKCAVWCSGSFCFLNAFVSEMTMHSISTLNVLRVTSHWIVVCRWAEQAKQRANCHKIEFCTANNFVVSNSRTAFP